MFWSADTIRSMKVISLQSGSNGNCFYVETPRYENSPAVRLLFDAGISARQAQLRLADHGMDICDVDALLISHDHSDHAKNMAIYQRKFGMPVYLTRRTLAASQRFVKNGSMDKVRLFTAGATLAFGDVAVHTIPTPHDSADGVAFVVEHGGQRVGILTDLGHAFEGLREVLESLDAVILESNYDDQMLEHGRYPYRLKQRIRGAGGHLSNEDSARLLHSVHGAGKKGRLQWACLCHLSEDNNTPEVARETHRKLLGDLLPIHVAPRYQTSEVFEVKVEKA